MRKTGRWALGGDANGGLPDPRELFKAIMRGDHAAIRARTQDIRDAEDALGGGLDADLFAAHAKAPPNPNALAEDDLARIAIAEECARKAR
ncbi:MAG: hypothetical protein V1723_03825 [Candidatus Uhrbacteria bacterium]